MIIIDCSILLLDYIEYKKLNKDKDPSGESPFLGTSKIKYNNISYGKDQNPSTLTKSTFNSATSATINTSTPMNMFNNQPLNSSTKQFGFFTDRKNGMKSMSGYNFYISINKIYRPI